MGKVIVVGSFNMDLVVRAQKIPRPGETLLGGEFFTALGGKGANQAVAAARMGAQVTFVCRIGEDASGDAALKSFEQDQINTRFVSRDPKLPTGTAVIIVAQDGQNSIVVAPGANGALNSECIEKAFPEVASNDVLLAQLETPLEGIEKIFEHARSLGKITILNPAPARALPASLLKWVSVITPNETETESLTGVAVTDANSAKKAAILLHERGIPIVIITLGEKGAYVSDASRDHSSLSDGELIPAPKVETVVDTTAAGDVFSGALAEALASQKLDLKSAVEFAMTAASVSVTRLGAQSSIPYLRELNLRLK